MSDPAETAKSLPAPSATTAPEDRVPLTQKIVYGFGTCHDLWGHWLYPSIALSVFNIYLGVPIALVTTALMLNRVFDALTDPFFGRMSDNTRTRFGRRRPYLLVGGVLAGLAMPLLFWVQPGWSDLGYFWFMLGSSAVFITLMSSFNMAYQSLGMEMTPDYHERTSLFTWKTALSQVPALANYFTPGFTTLAIWVGATQTDVGMRVLRLLTGDHDAWHRAGAGQKPNILLGAQVGFTVLGIIMVVVALLSFTLLRERYYKQVVKQDQPKVSLKDIIVGTLRCQPFRLLLGALLSFVLGQGMVSTLSYYNTIYYVCNGDVALANTWNFAMGIGSMVLGVVCLPMFSSLARRFGKRRTLMGALMFMAVAFIATWWLYNPAHPWLLPLSWGLIGGTCSSAFWMLYQSVTADVMDFDELNTGMRREGAFNACASWMIKAGYAVGIGSSGLLIAATGFDAKLGAAQSEQTVFWIRFLLPAMPVAGLILGIIFVSRFPLTHARMDEIRQQLEARRGKV